MAESPAIRSGKNEAYWTPPILFTGLHAYENCVQSAVGHILKISNHQKIIRIEMILFATSFRKTGQMV